MGMHKKQKLITEKSKLLVMMNGKKCAKCPRTEMLTVDHVIPIAILRDFGLSLEEMYELEYLQVYCRPCNSLKANKIDVNLPETKTILLKLLDRF